MTTSAPHIWAFERTDTELRAALNSGWRRSDLWWERLQERGNRAVLAGNRTGARIAFVAGDLLARMRFSADDPRRATSLANRAVTASGSRRHGLYARASALWAGAPSSLDDLHVRPRARSSLFHLRMEAKHWDTYVENARVRLGRFMAETAECLGALERNEAPPHRLFSRWNGEKPSVFDDTRKVLGACLLVASDGNPDH